MAFSPATIAAQPLRELLELHETKPAKARGVRTPYYFGVLVLSLALLLLHRPDCHVGLNFLTAIT